MEFTDRQRRLLDAMGIEVWRSGDTQVAVDDAPYYTYTQRSDANQTLLYLIADAKPQQAPLLQKIVNSCIAAAKPTDFDLDSIEDGAIVVCFGQCAKAKLEARQLKRSLLFYLPSLSQIASDTQAKRATFSHLQRLQAYLAWL